MWWRLGDKGRQTKDVNSLAFEFGFLHLPHPLRPWSFML